jgi:hypothetical protein
MKHPRIINSILISAIAFFLIPNAISGQTPGGWEQNYLRVYLETTSDKVGIGTETPDVKLDIQGGGVHIGTAHFNAGTGDLHVADQVRIGINDATYLYVDQSGISAGPTGSDLLLNRSGGNVGIGTEDPSAKMEIYGGDLEITTGDIRIVNGENSKIWHSAHNLTFENQNNNHHQVIVQPGTHSSNVYSMLYLKSRPNGTDLETRIQLHTNGISYFNGGRVGIGTTDPGSYELAVKGEIRAYEVVVETGWSDYVFEDDYQLTPLDEVERYINENKHLPGIPSAAEIEANGVSLGDMQAKLLEKIEELTLHLIDLKKENEALKDRVTMLEE